MTENIWSFLIQPWSSSLNQIPNPYNPIFQDRIFSASSIIWVTSRAVYFAIPIWLIIYEAAGGPFFNDWWWVMVRTVYFRRSYIYRFRAVYLKRKDRVFSNFEDRVFSKTVYFQYWDRLFSARIVYFNYGPIWRTYRNDFINDNIIKCLILQLILNMRHIKMKSTNSKFEKNKFGGSIFLLWYEWF